MHRQSLLYLLENHTALDADEKRMTLETIEFIKNNEKCFDRNLLSGHVTGSAWILDASHAYALLTHHKKLNQWFQPGGHCDGDSDVLQVALKEAQEETGYTQLKVVSTAIFDVDVHLIPERKGVPAHWHYDIRFLLEADKNIPFTLSEESHALKWIKLSELEHYTNSPSVLRMTRK